MKRQRLIQALAAALKGTHHQLADVTDYYTTIALDGTKAREALMKISTIDWDARVFKAGMGATTPLGRATPFTRMVSDNPPAFEIVIRISMADYLWCLLAEAGHEWGMPAQHPKGQVKLHLPHFS